MECQKMNITPKVILSNFRSFPISPVRESHFSLISCFPPWGKAVFRCFLIFPREGRPFFAVFLFSLVKESRFSLFFVHRTPTKAYFSCFSSVVPLRKPIFPVFRPSYPYESLFLLFFVRRTPTKAYFFCFPFIVPLRKPLSAVFRPSYPYESLFFLFSVHRTPYLDNFSRKSTIYSRIWTDFLENRQFTIVSEQIFPKTDDLLSYLNEFPEKRRKDHLSTQKRVLKWSFLIGLF